MNQISVVSIKAKLTQTHCQSKMWIYLWTRSVGGSVLHFSPPFSLKGFLILVDLSVQVKTLQLCWSLRGPAGNRETPGDPLFSSSSGRTLPFLLCWKQRQKRMELAGSTCSNTYFWLCHWLSLAALTKKSHQVLFWTYFVCPPEGKEHLRWPSSELVFAYQISATTCFPHTEWTVGVN